MSQIVTLELPEEVALRAREVATRTQRRLEDVLLEWLDQVVVAPPVESLPNDEILALCDLQMGTQQNDELSELLARNQEGLLDERERLRLDELMQTYRQGLLRKAQALRVAVARGLRPPLN